MSWGLLGLVCVLHVVVFCLHKGNFRAFRMCVGSRGILQIRRDICSTNGSTAALLAVRNPVNLVLFRRHFASLMYSVLLRPFFFTQVY